MLSAGILISVLLFIMMIIVIVVIVRIAHMVYDDKQYIADLSNTVGTISNALHTLDADLQDKVQTLEFADKNFQNTIYSMKSTDREIMSRVDSLADTDRTTTDAVKLLKGGSLLSSTLPTGESVIPSPVTTNSSVAPVGSAGAVVEGFEASPSTTATSSNIGSIPDFWWTKEKPGDWLSITQPRGGKFLPGGLAAANLWARDSIQLGSNGCVKLGKNGSTICQNGPDRLDIASRAVNVNTSLTVGAPVWPSSFVGPSSGLLSDRLVVNGGASTFNANKLPSEFPDARGINQIRGDTILSGHLQTVAPVSVSGIYIGKNYTNYEKKGDDKAEIANDVGTHKRLMIVGNRSADQRTRRVGVMDDLDVYGNASASNVHARNKLVFPNSTNTDSISMQRNAASALQMSMAPSHAFEIWPSNGSTHVHKFDASGAASHNSVNVNGKISLCDVNGASCIDLNADGGKLAVCDRSTKQCSYITPTAASATTTA